MVVTFLPYPDIKKSVKCLDNQRLGKQRVEAYTIVNSIFGIKKGWRKHPVTLMWVGYENCLKYYVNECLNEWISRGFKNNMKFYDIEGEIVYPWWFGWEIFHQSHMCSLTRKAPWHYEELFANQFETFLLEYGYVWPSKYPEDLRTKELTRALADMVCDPINLNQLRPMCVKDGCLNRGKDCKLENGEILEEFCGVHFRTFVNQTKKKQKEIEKKTKKIEKMAVIKSIRVTRSKSKKK